MKFINQQEKYDCGHACIAMLSGKSIEEIKQKIGYPKSLHAKHIVRFNRKFSFFTIVDHYDYNEGINFANYVWLVNIECEKNKNERHWVIFDCRVVDEESLVSYYKTVYDPHQSVNISMKVWNWLDSEKEKGFDWEPIYVIQVKL